MSSRRADRRPGPAQVEAVSPPRRADSEREPIVGFGNLRVRIGRDGSYWYARGLELDYEALGDTPAQARRHFTDGLAATAREHRRVHGHLDHLLTPAPSEVWREFLREARLLSRIESDPAPAEVNPPFTGIAYYGRTGADSDAARPGASA